MKVLITHEESQMVMESFLKTFLGISKAMSEQWIGILKQ